MFYQSMEGGALMNSFFKKLLVFVVVSGLMVCSVTGALAFTNVSTDELSEFELGAVLVSLEYNSPSVESLLPGFKITESKLITPGSSTQKVYHIVFSEKTEDIVWEAIEILNSSSYVKAAEPNYYMQIDPVEEPTTVEPTETPGIPELYEFELGAVLVSLEYNSPSVESLLPGFKITESKLITPGSSTQKVYHIVFSEKTEDIVWEAIEILNSSPYVKSAEPNYYMQIDPADPIETMVPCDVDGDGVVSIMDATVIQRHIAQLSTIADERLKFADADKDGEVSIVDATHIQRKLAGLTDDE